MAKKKLLRFAEMANFPNVIQLSTHLRGVWHRDYFHNDNPITLELACGKGDYTVALARMFPDRNFVGVDLKGARLWRGARTALDESLNNVAFVRLPIEQIAACFGPQEIAEIWITFPDPFLRAGKAKKRLTSPRFINLYRQILIPGGTIHLKTDEPNLFAFSQEVIQTEQLRLLQKIEDLYANRIENPVLAIQTTYEKRHLADGRTIRYLAFSI